MEGVGFPRIRGVSSPASSSGAMGCFPRPWDAYIHTPITSCCDPVLCGSSDGARTNRQFRRASSTGNARRHRPLCGRERPSLAPWLATGGSEWRASQLSRAHRCHGRGHHEHDDFLGHGLTREDTGRVRCDRCEWRHLRAADTAGTRPRQALNVLPTEFER
jgi:hypothetical protein